MADFSKYVSDAFEAVTPDLYSIHNDAVNYEMSDWRTKQSALVTASGAASVAIPGLHLLGRMAVCCYGIGTIIGREAGEDYVLEDEDFAIILARWCKVDGVSNGALSKAAAEGSKVALKAGLKIGNKVAYKELAKVACKQAGILIAKKAGTKGMGLAFAGQLGARFGTKLGGKALGGFIPFAGAVIGGGINLWFITEMAREAESWYNFKVNGQ
jgi:hypothetical protein